MQAGVTIESDVVRLFNEVDRSLGKLTHVVNNAGIVRPQMKVADMTAARINEILVPNVIGQSLKSASRCIISPLPLIFTS